MRGGEGVETRPAESHANALFYKSVPGVPSAVPSAPLLFKTSCKTSELPNTDSWLINVKQGLRGFRWFKTHDHRTAPNLEDSSRNTYRTFLDDLKWWERLNGISGVLCPPKLPLLSSGGAGGRQPPAKKKNKKNLFTRSPEPAYSPTIL